MINRHSGGAARRRRPPSRLGEDGFTILELMVVVAIIGILLASTLPGFNAARSSAQDKAAQANIRTAIVAANTAFISAPDQSFDSITAAVLSAAEPSLRWSPDEWTKGPGTIAVLTGTVVVDSVAQGAGIGVAVDAGNGLCWYAFQADNTAPMYGAAGKSAATCDAADAGSFASGNEL